MILNIFLDRKYTEEKMNFNKLKYIQPSSSLEETQNLLIQESNGDISGGVFSDSLYETKDDMEDIYFDVGPNTKLYIEEER